MVTERDDREAWKGLLGPLVMTGSVVAGVSLFFGVIVPQLAVGCLMVAALYSALAGALLASRDDAWRARLLANIAATLGYLALVVLVLLTAADGALVLLLLFLRSLFHGPHQDSVVQWILSIPALGIGIVATAAYIGWAVDQGYPASDADTAPAIVFDDEGRITHD